MNDRRLYIGGGLTEGNRLDALKPGIASARDITDFY